MGSLDLKSVLQKIIQKKSIKKFLLEFYEKIYIELQKRVFETKYYNENFIYGSIFLIPSLKDEIIEKKQQIFEFFDKLISHDKELNYFKNENSFHGDGQLSSEVPYQQCLDENEYITEDSHETTVLNLVKENNLEDSSELDIKTYFTKKKE